MTLLSGASCADFEQRIQLENDYRRAFIARLRLLLARFDANDRCAYTSYPNSTKQSSLRVAAQQEEVAGYARFYCPKKNVEIQQKTWLDVQKSTNPRFKLACGLPLEQQSQRCPALSKLSPRRVNLRDQCDHRT